MYKSMYPPSPKFNLLLYLLFHMHTGNGPVKLGDILKLVSGASKISPSGFPTNPSIKFCCDAKGVYMRCITFPQKLDLLQFDQFKETMDLSILGSCGFDCLI